MPGIEVQSVHADRSSSSLRVSASHPNGVGPYKVEECRDRCEELFAPVVTQPDAVFHRE